MRVSLPLGAIAAAAVLVAGCGQSPNPPAAAPAAAAMAPATGASAVNALVCKHYARQYAWKQHVTFPSLATAVKWEMYVAADAGEAQSGTRLARDLQAELTAMQDALKGKKYSYKNGTVARDCGIGA